MRPLVLAITLLGFMHAFAVHPPAEKILQVTVTESGTISVGRDTISSDALAPYIQERLFKSYMGTGHMHSRINCTIQTPAVPGMVIDVVLQEIHEGQQRALTELCLQRYKKRFDAIDKKQQVKLKKHFPVLFQTVSQQSPGV